MLLGDTYYNLITQTNKAFKMSENKERTTVFLDKEARMIVSDFQKMMMEKFGSEFSDSMAINSLVKGAVSKGFEIK